MQYLTGIHALNVPCPTLDTSGDWHQSALRWEDLTLADTDTAILKDYGIFLSEKVPDGTGGYKTMYVADTIRALFDLLLAGNTAVAQGMRDDFICNEAYTPEVFRVATMLKQTEQWHVIDKFLEREYELDWLNFKEDSHV